MTTQLQTRNELDRYRIKCMFIFTYILKIPIIGLRRMLYNVEIYLLQRRDIKRLHREHITST